MRLIDADALEADLKRQYNEVFGDARKTVNPDDFFIERLSAYIANVFKAEQEGFFKYLKARPTVDAVPMEHGKWKERHLPADTIMTTEETWYMCSVCYATYSDVTGFRYCPYCGAMMDGGAEDETD